MRERGEKERDREREKERERAMRFLEVIYMTGTYLRILGSRKTHLGGRVIT